MNAGFPDRAVATAGVGDKISVFFGSKERISRSDAVSHFIKNQRIKYAIAHIYRFFRFKTIFLHPFHPFYSADEFQWEFHVVCDPFFGYFEAFAVTRHEDDIHMRFKKQEPVVVVCPKRLHHLAFSSVIKPAIGHHTVDVYDEVFDVLFHCAILTQYRHMQSLRNKVFGLLRSSERLFKLDMVYLAKGGWWTSLSFIIGILASFVTMVAFGNLLPREVYGTYNYLLSLGASLSFLTLSGIGPAVMRAVARGYENVTPRALRLSLKYNSLSIAIVLTVASYYAFKGNMLFAFSLTLLSLAYPLAESFHIYKQILTGRKRFDTLAKITSAISLIGAIATVTALLLTDNILILIALYASMSLLPNIIVYFLVTRHIGKMEPVPEQLQEMKRTAIHITGAGIAGIVSSYIDKVILFQVAGPAALAIYGFAAAGPERLKSLVKNWFSIALPSLAQKSLSQIRQVVYKRVAFSFLIGLILAATYWLLAPVLFKTFLPRYLDAVFYSQILALSVTLAPASIYFGSVFASQNMLKATYALNFANHATRIVLYVIFGWLWQIWGLIIASLLSTFINAVYGLVIWEIEYRRLMKKNGSTSSP